MKPVIETIRLSEKEKRQLIALKRKTGIDNWNVLCRWAFCLSLAEVSDPPHENIPSDSSIEMTWKTFSGNSPELYHALLITRAHESRPRPNSTNLMQFFRIHLSRGISYLSNTEDLPTLLSLPN